MLNDYLLREASTSGLRANPPSPHRAKCLFFFRNFFQYQKKVIFSWWSLHPLSGRSTSRGIIFLRLPFTQLVADLLPYTLSFFSLTDIVVLSTGWRCLKSNLSGCVEMDFFLKAALISSSSAVLLNSSSYSLHQGSRKKITVFFLSGQALTPPLLVAGQLKRDRNLFLRLPLRYEMGNYFLDRSSLEIYLKYIYSNKTKNVSR